MDWLTGQVIALTLTAGAIGVLHTVLGPDHYVPFIALGRSRGWSLRRTLGVAGVCGVGHVLGSLLLGLAGIVLGRALADLMHIESVRGDLAAWALLAFGLAYTVWGMRHAARARVHVHAHGHADGTWHRHEHDHHRDHVHPHQSPQRGALAVWGVFIVFVLGPCEALIPVLMYPAAQHNYAGLALVTVTFAVTTIATMLTLVAAGTVWLGRIRASSMERYVHVFAGGAISLCAAAMLAGL